MRSALRLRDRTDAGQKLAERLSPHAGEGPVVVGLPRGGVVVAFEVARALGAPLDVLIVRKVGHPGNPEYGLGAATESGEVLLDEDRMRESRLTRRDLLPEIEVALGQVRDRVRRYRSVRPAVPLTDRVVILVDDGIATGGTVEAAVRTVRHQKPRRIILAVGVLPSESRSRIASHVDELVYLRAPEEFMAVGEWYEAFDPVEDDGVLRLLEGAAPTAAATGQAG